MKLKLLISLVLFSSHLFSQIPAEIEDHIASERAEISKIGSFGFNHDQIDMIIDRYIESMSTLYEIKVNKAQHKEIAKKIKNIVPLPSKKEGTHNFNFRGLKIPLSFAGDENSDRQILVLNGILRDSSDIPFSQFDSACLQVSLNDDLKTLHIDWIATADLVCPIPVKEKAGAYLLDLAEAIAKQMSYDRIELEDTSDIRNERGYITSLGYLRAFSKGETWYNSRGYFSSLGKEEDLKKSRLFHQTKMEDVVNSFNEMAKINPDKLALNVKNKIDNIKNHQTHFIENYYNMFSQRVLMLNKSFTKFDDKSSSIGAFFTWLWQHNPHVYIEIKELIFPEKSFTILPEELTWITQMKLDLGNLLSKNLRESTESNLGPTQAIHSSPRS